MVAGRGHGTNLRFSAMESSNLFTSISNFCNSSEVECLAEASSHQGDAKHFPGVRNATCVANCVVALVTTLLGGMSVDTKEALDCFKIGLRPI